MRLREQESGQGGQPEGGAHEVMRVPEKQGRIAEKREARGDGRKALGGRVRAGAGAQGESRPGRLAGPDRATRGAGQGPDRAFGHPAAEGSGNGETEGCGSERPEGAPESVRAAVREKIGTLALARETKEAAIPMLEKEAEEARKALEAAQAEIGRLDAEIREMEGFLETEEK